MYVIYMYVRVYVVCSIQLLPPLTAGVLCEKALRTNLACAAIAFLALSDFIANYLKISAYFPGECMMIGMSICQFVPLFVCLFAYAARGIDEVFPLAEMK